MVDVCIVCAIVYERQTKDKATEVKCKRDQSTTNSKFNFLSKDQLTKKKDRILIKDLISNK